MNDLDRAVRIGIRLGFAIHIRSAEIAPQTDELVEASKEALVFIEEYAQALRNSSAE